MSPRIVATNIWWPPCLIYKRTHNIRAIQLLLGHTKLESTVRYLGIEVDDALEMSEQTEVWVQLHHGYTVINGAISQEITLALRKHTETVYDD